MSFDVGADAYARFMGRYSEPLAVELADALAPRPGTTAIDVGCGPGALTSELVRRLGADAVRAVDPSASFVEAVRARLPGVDIRHAAAESLPFDTDSADLVAAQLAVHFMSDPVRGLTEMARVAKPGGRVAANVWDHAGGRGPLSVYWQAARELDPDVRDESGLAGARAGHLAELFAEVPLEDVETFSLTVHADFAGFDAWWETFTLGVGPAGDYVARLDEASRAALRSRCSELLPDGPFQVSATAWTAVGTVRESGAPGHRGSLSRRRSAGRC